MRVAAAASALLLSVLAVEAFVSKPSFSRRPATTTSSLFGSGVVTGPDGKAASSAEEDLELTQKVILDFIGSSNDEGSSVGSADSDGGEEEAPKKKKKKKKKKSPPPAAPEVAIDVSKLDIRVGVINKAWEHEEADKLYCEEIDVGEEGGPRQIASGLRAHYELGELEGRRVCVLANLKARKLVGFKSHGMVLCASTEDGSKVVFVEPPEDAAIGERVMAEGFDGEPATENQVIKKKMLDAIFPDLKTNEDGVATYKGVPLTAGSGKCVAQDGLANAPVS